MTLDALGSIAGSGVLGAIVAYLLWRLREKDKEHQDVVKDIVERNERANKHLADSVTSLSDAQRDTSVALGNLGGWLQGRLK